jgi:hypothetical protein
MKQFSEKIFKEKLSRFDPKVHGGEIMDFSPLGREFPCKRELGFMQGRFKVRDDFDTIEKDKIEQLFNGTCSEVIQGDSAWQS